MPFTIATKAAFLVLVTWFPEGHSQHDFVKHEYQVEYPSAEMCFEAAQAMMEPETVDWTMTDAGCTYQPPISKNMVFFIPENAADNWENEGFFITLK